MRKLPLRIIMTSGKTMEKLLLHSAGTEKLNRRRYAAPIDIILTAKSRKKTNHLGVWSLSSDSVNC